MKGQMSIYGLIFGLVALLLFAGLIGPYYQLIQSVNGNATASGDTITPIFMNLVVPMFGLSVLLIPVLYSLGGRGKTQQFE